MSCGRQSSGPLRHPPAGAGIHGHHRPPALTALRGSHKLNGCPMRWALALQAYQYAIKDHPGIHHQNADGLSRQSWPEDDDSLLGETGTPSTTSKNEECRGHQQSENSELNRLSSGGGGVQLTKGRCRVYLLDNGHDSPWTDSLDSYT